MHIKSRIKYLKALAADPAVPVGTTTVTPSTNVTVTPFSPATYYPKLYEVWGANNKDTIEKICKVVNEALFYTSGDQFGQNRMGLDYLQRNNFKIDLSKVEDKNAQIIVGFCDLLKNKLFTYNGNPYSKPLSKQQIMFLKTEMLRSDQLSKIMNTTFPYTEAAKKTKVDELKTLNNLILRLN